MRSPRPRISWHSVRRALAVVSTLGLGWASSAATALAQCEEPRLGPQDVLPAVGAGGVTTDAWVRARYSPGYFGPAGPGEDPASLIRIVRCGACGASCDDAEPIGGHVEVLADDLFFVPDAPLEPGTQYGGEALGLETSVTLRFCTGDGRDVAAPVLGGGIRWSAEEVGPGCELPDGGFRVGVFAGAATDDGPGGSLEYLLFLTRADGLDAPVLVDRVRGVFASGEITLRLFLDGAQAASPVCVRAGVVDGVGNVTMADSEQCFDPVGKVTFQGCAVSPGRRASAGPLVGLASIGVLLWAGARRRRRSR